MLKWAKAGVYASHTCKQGHSKALFKGGATAQSFCLPGYRFMQCSLPKATGFFAPYITHCHSPQDGGHKHKVDSLVEGVTVVRAIESELVLQVEVEAKEPHGGLGPAELHLILPFFQKNLLCARTGL